jgi:DNA primase
LSSDAHAQDDLIEAIIACIGPDAWRRSGMARLSLGFSWSDHVLAIPWVDERGRVIALQRRMIGPVGPGTPPYVFSNGRRATAPYGIDSLVNVSLSAPVAFVEGAMDVLSMRALCAKRGVQRAVLGLPGVSAWKPEWARLATGRDALVCVDADPAGERVVSMIAADLRAAGATRVVRMRPLTGKDWNDALMMEAP